MSWAGFAYPGVLVALVIPALRGVETHQDRVWVFFDENEVLSHMGVTLDAHRADFSVPPWTDAD